MDTIAELVDAMRQSLLRLTGRDLAWGLDASAGMSEAVRRAPYVLVAHDASPDPVFVYGNDSALELFEMDWWSFTSLPSRLSAEPDEQGERERLLQGVAERGYISDYRGVRVSATGRRFRIEDAIVWDVVDEQGRVLGQAALFDRWTRLDTPAYVVDEVPDPAHGTDDWSGRHDLGWSDSPIGATTSEALAATVAAAESLPHHDLGPAPSAEPVAPAAHVGWTAAYAAADLAAGEHARTEPQPSSDPGSYEPPLYDPARYEPQAAPAAEQPAYDVPAEQEPAYDAPVLRTGIAIDDPMVVNEVRVIDDRIAVVDDPASGTVTRERVRTFLTLGPRGTDTELAVGYDVDAPPEVRPLTRDELDVVLSWCVDAGWNPGLHDADALWAADPDALWGVEVDGVLVGAGSTVRRGSRAGGVGLLVVDPAHRRQGIGSMTFPFLVDGALSRLEPGAGIALDCPEAHQDFCERFGFVPIRRIARSTTTVQPGRRGPYAGQLRALAQLPFDKLVAYDAQFAGGERPEWLRAWMTPRDGLGIGAYEAGRFLGIGVIRRARDGHRIGPFYAESREVAEDLYSALTHTVVGQRISLDVPLEDTDVVAFATSKGFTVASEVVHMQLGEVDGGAREHVYGEASPQYG
ncbi:MAG TPA: GNAT family N-acetyltransferase [Candidatus Nanopelagicales bacterium]|nr:GNAT family N-acetyltransferase [Candidatus Nanopelagicales bacterium]